jgi:hypothetical protein
LLKGKKDKLASRRCKEIKEIRKQWRREEWKTSGRGEGSI